MSLSDEPITSKGSDREKRIGIICHYNFDGLFCLICLLFQQIIVASSTFFIIKTIQAVELSDHRSLTIYGVCFVVSLTLVHVPNALSHIFLDRFYVTTLNRYLNKFLLVNQARPTLSHRAIRSKYESWITLEATSTFRESTLVLYDFFSTFLNATLSIIVIAYMLDLALLLAYALAGVFVYTSMRVFRHNLRHASRNVQEARKQLADILLAAWDNVVLGHKSYKKKWLASFNTQTINTNSAFTKYNLVRSSISFLSTLLALTCVVIGNLFVVVKAQNNFTLVASVVVTFPRQVQVLQNTFMFFSAMLEWDAIGIRIAGLATPLSIKAPTENYIQIDKLSFCGIGVKEKYSSEYDFIHDLENLPVGRVTIRGENGTGKSTLLARLAEHFSENATYLPTKYDLMFDDETIRTASDGERLVRVLNEFLEKGVGEYVLLDEWDASLDAGNLKKVTALIEEIAFDHVIVEVRHRDHKNNNSLINEKEDER